MREKGRFSNGGFRDRNREVERKCVNIEDDFEKRCMATAVGHGQNPSPRPIAAHHGLWGSPRANCGVCWTLEFFHFPGLAPYNSF